MTHGYWWEEGNERKMGCARRPTETIAVTDKKSTGCACAYKKNNIEGIEMKKKKKKENDRNDVIDNGDTVGFHFDYIRQHRTVEVTAWRAEDSDAGKDDVVGGGQSK